MSAIRQKEQPDEIDLSKVFRLARENLAARLGATPNPITKHYLMKQLSSLYALEISTLHGQEVGGPASDSCRR